MNRNWKKTIICVVIIGACFLILGGLACLGINMYVRSVVSERILTVEEASELDADCILVLGSGIKLDGTPGKVLTDRLDKSLVLYEQGTSE